MLYFTSLNSKINDKFDTKIRLTDTFESSNKLVKVFYGSKDSFTPLQPFLPWGFANFEPFTCLPKVNNVCNNIILQIEHFQDLKKTKNCAVPSETTQDLVNLASVPFPWSLAVHHRSVAFRVRLCEIRSSWGKGWIKAASLDFAAQNFWFQVMIFRVGSRIFFGRGALVSCSTSTPINHIVIFFGRIPVVLENCRSSRGGGCTPPAPSP